MSQPKQEDPELNSLIELYKANGKGKKLEESFEMERIRRAALKEKNRKKLAKLRRKMKSEPMSQQRQEDPELDSIKELWKANGMEKGLEKSYERERIRRAAEKERNRKKLAKKLRRKNKSEDNNSWNNHYIYNNNVQQNCEIGTQFQVQHIDLIQYIEARKNAPKEVVDDWSNLVLRNNSSICKNLGNGNNRKSQCTIGTNIQVQHVDLKEYAQARQNIPKEIVDEWVNLVLRNNSLICKNLATDNDKKSQGNN